MIQAFYTSASGMYVQQKNIDIISNNISNTETPGYRIKRVEFQELLKKQATKNNTETSTRYGTKIANISTMPLPDDINIFGMNIEGNGYFAVEDSAKNRSYTKIGDFKLLSENGKNFLATKNNEYVLDENNNKIELGSKPENVVVSQGVLYPDGNNGEAGIRLSVVTFSDVSALGAKNKDYFVETAMSAKPFVATNAHIVPSYYEELAPLAMENQTNEMTKIVQTQMAYSFNSKALQIADEMEGMANHLRY